MDIHELLGRFRAIEIRTRRKLGGGPSSAYRNAFRGQGLEFSEVREYVEGDDVRLVDWNVSARFGGLHVKQLMEERELAVVFALQASRSMDFGSTRKTKYFTSAEALSTVVFSSIHAGDRPGLALFGGASHLTVVPPRKGVHHGLLLLGKMAEHPLTEPVCDPSRLLNYLARGLKKRCVVFVAGDFIYSKWDSEMLATAARRHDLIALCVTDPCETEGPPPGIYRLTDGRACSAVSVSGKGRAGFARAVRERKRSVESLFRRAGADWLDITTESEPDVELERFFHRRFSGRAFLK